MGRRSAHVMIETNRKLMEEKSWQKRWGKAFHAEIS
jgi:hypothetical protein